MLTGKGHKTNQHHNYYSVAKTNTYSDFHRKRLYVSDAAADSRTVTISFPLVSGRNFELLLFSVRMSLLKGGEWKELCIAVVLSEDVLMKVRNDKLLKQRKFAILLLF